MKLINNSQSNLNINNYYNIEPLKEFIYSLEMKYPLYDETERLKEHVNFSTAKSTAYQRWLRYREGYSTLLVEELIMRSEISPSNYFVADPMMGSGTTLISALNLGYDSLGIDVNPLCRLLVQGKTLRPNMDVIKEVLDLSRKIVSEPMVDLSSSERLFSEYFTKDNLQLIEYLKLKIDEIENHNVKTICLLAWFCILEDCSNRKKDGNGLASRTSLVKDVFSCYINKVDQILNDYKNYPLNYNPKIKALTASAVSFSSISETFGRQIGKTLGAVIFSPPYANSFDYFESYKLELLFGEIVTKEDFYDIKKTMIRNYRIGYGKEIKSDIEVVEMLCKEIWNAIPIKEAQTKKRDGRTRLVPNMLRGYFADMRKVLEEIFAGLSPGGNCYIVVDQSAYVGVIIPTDIILAWIGESIGFKVNYISKCRKATTSGQQLQKHPYLRNILREGIVVLSKPI
jgi:hypothetical protein